MMNTRSGMCRLALWCVSMVGALSLPARADPIISIQPPSSIVAPGQSFSIDIRISDVVDLFAYQFDLTFTPSIVSADDTDVTAGPFLQGAGLFAFGAAGAINVADSLAGPIGGVTGTGILANVQFDALAPGTSALTLSNVILLDSTLSIIPFQTSGGSATVTPEPGTWLLLGTGLLALGVGRRLLS